MLSMIATLTLNIKTIAEDVIKTAPKLINPLRDTSKFMAVDEVLTLYKENNIIEKKYTLEEKVLGSSSKKSYSESVAALDSALCELTASAPSFAIYTQMPVSFSLLALEDQIIIIDTHRIDESLGGNGNGAVVVFRQNNQSEKHSFYNRASEWILNRCGKSLKIAPQSLVVLTETNTSSSSSPSVKQEDIKFDVLNELNSVAWDDEDLLKMTSESSNCEVHRLSTDKFVDIPTTSSDVTIQGYATKLGIMKLKDFQLRAVKAVLEGRDCLIVQ